MAIYEIKTDEIAEIKPTSFGLAGLSERYDLQRLLRKHVHVISPDTLVIAEEFGDWDESKRRIDLLGIDKEANLVVIELKRTEDGGHMELQAIRYAAMVSTMTFEKVVEIYARHLARQGSSVDARTELLNFLGWSEADETNFAQDVRIVLVSADFSKELTTSVMWLNERDLDIRCIRLKPYSDNGRVLIDVQQVIPLPEAVEYQIQIREKEQKGRQEGSAMRHTLRRKFWEGLLNRAAKLTRLHENISAGTSSYIGTTVGGIMYKYLIRQDECAVQLYIDRGAGHEQANKQMFDALHAHRDEVEKAFGAPMSWQRNDNAQGSYIEFPMAIGGWKSDEAEWPAIQDSMIQAMIRLEKAVAPHTAALKGVVG